MRSVVMKFGGSSVINAAAIAGVTSIVATERTADQMPVVVVSAMAGVTDTLLSLAEAAACGDAPAVEAGIDALRRRHVEAAVTLTDGDDRTLLAAIASEFDELAGVFRVISSARAVDPAAMDMVMAIGELLSSRIVAAAMSARALPAVWVDARLLIATDAQHTRAVPILERIREAADLVLAPLLADGQLPVLGGFLGRAPNGATTTLGRGGSDYSASLIGAAIAASEIQIWTDVDGMLTADPRIVPNGDVVPLLSFAEAAELAYFGAKVLHPSTIFPAVSRSIPVRIRNSCRPEAKGTLITASRSPVDRPFAALAGKRGITVIDIISTRMLMAHGFLQRVFEVFEEFETSVDVVTTSEVSVSVTIDDNRHLSAIISALQHVADVTADEDMAILSVVGEGLRHDSSLAARIIGALTGFPLKMVSQAASRRNVTVVLPGPELARAMTHLHREFFAMAGSSR
jgi:aspartate kinase